jgi:hypothetical protein
VHGQPSVGPLRTLASYRPKGAKDGRRSSIRLDAAAVSREVLVGSTVYRLFAASRHKVDKPKEASACQIGLGINDIRSRAHLRLVVHVAEGYSINHILRQ